MRIMHTVDEQLDVRLEDILVLVEPSVDIVSYLLQFLQDIDWRLLVAFWRVLQIREGALELEGLVVIVDEANGYIINERDVRQAFENVGCVEERISCYRQKGRADVQSDSRYPDYFPQQYLRRHR